MEINAFNNKIYGIKGINEGEYENYLFNLIDKPIINSNTNNFEKMYEL